MIVFTGNIAVSGIVTFLGDAVNNGTINGSATFKGTSKNTGEITGSGNFLDNSINAGEVGGNIVYDPPILARWILLAFASGDPWTARKLGTYRQYGGEIIQDHPTQPCPYPNNGCYTYPNTYRSLVNFNYVLDYEHFPEYLNYVGNPEDEGVVFGFYYKPTINNNWATLGNWYSDSAFETPAAALPPTGANVYLDGSCTANSGDTPVVANLAFSPFYVNSNRTFGIAITVTGLATFTGGAYVTGTIYGNADFRASSELAVGGVVNGRANFYSTATNNGTVSGTAAFFDSACNDAGTATTFNPNPPPTC
jgi:hypothetical protein